MSRDPGHAAGTANPHAEAQRDVRVRAIKEFLQVGQPIVPGVFAAQTRVQGIEAEEHVPAIRQAAAAGVRVGRAGVAD